MLGSRQLDGATEFRGAVTGKNGTGYQGGSQSPGGGRRERAWGSPAIASHRVRTPVQRLPMPGVFFFLGETPDSSDRRQTHKQTHASKTTTC